MTQSSQRVRAAGWLTHTDPAGLLYGAIVSAAVLATVSAHAEGSEFVALATAMVLVVYWMAHVYIAALVSASSTATPATSCSACARRAPTRRASSRAACRPSSSTWGRTLPGWTSARPLTAAVYFTVVLLAAVGYLGAHQAGLRGRAALLEVAGAASFGVLIVAAKALLH